MVFVGLPLIVLGDKTSHGGTVISADMTSTINGRAMARIGDRVACRKCKGVFSIVSGAADVLDGEERAYARHGDKTSCGAVLIASQGLTTWSDESDSGRRSDALSALASSATPAVAIPAPSGICLSCLRKAAHLGTAVVVRDS